MAQGTVDDIISEVGQLAASMSDALNELNAKLDQQFASLQTQINALQGGTGGNTPSGVQSNPNPVVAPSGSPAGTQFAVLSCPQLPQPVTFTILNPTGHFAIANTDRLVAGLVELDYAQGDNTTVTIRATAADGVTSVTSVLPVQITQASGLATIDLNFVTFSALGASFTDISIVQAASITELTSTGTQGFGANELRHTNLGLWCKGTSAEWIGQNAKNPDAWTATAPGWTGAIKTSLGADASGFVGIRYESTNAADGAIYDGGLTEALADGDTVTIKVRVKDGPTSGGLALLFRRGAAVGTTGTGSTIAVVSAGTIGNGNIPNVVMIDADFDYVGYSHVSGSGEVDLVFRFTVPATEGDTYEFGVNTASATAGQTIDLRGLQVVRGPADLDWKSVTTATYEELADDITIGGELATILNSQQGWFGIELQALDHQTIGTGGYPDSVAGTILEIGGNAHLKPKGPTAFEVEAGAPVEGVLGLSGFRGIVRIALTWHNVTGWAAYANGGKIASGAAGTLPTAGTIKLMKGITGRVRRISAGPTVIPNAAAKQWSSLINRTFTRPGNALVPGLSRVTFNDDFDANSMQTIAAPAFPYSSIEGMLNAYAPNSWANGKFWKPRMHNHTQNGQGSFPNHSGQHELQHYQDPQYADAYQTHVIADSMFKGYTALVSTLTVDQQAAVPENPDTPGVKAKYTSWIITTFSASEQEGANTLNEGGFYQRFGVFNARMKIPAYRGSWAAFWLYRWRDTSELDIEELYGATSIAGPTKPTFAAHADNFAWNAPVPPAGPKEIGYDITQDFHDWTCVWVQGNLKKYIDGELFVETGTGGSFDAQPKAMLFNMAITPDAAPPYDDADPAPDAAAEAAMPWETLIDRVTVLQFGAA